MSSTRNDSAARSAVTEGLPGARTFRLARKELREILRDRRTIITLILMPLLVYPLLGVIMRKGLLSSLEGLTQVEVHLIAESEVAAESILKTLQQAEYLLTEETSPPASADTDTSAEADSADTAAVEALLGGQTDQPIRFQVAWADSEDSQAAVRFQVAEGYSDLGILLKPLANPEQPVFDLAGNPLPFQEWQLLRRAESNISDRAYEEVTRRLQALNQRYLDELLRQHGLSSIKPAEIQEIQLQNQGTGGYSLITFIPLVLVLMTMTGAVYPAIDLTAGERERGTMEILVAAPVSRMTLLGGKFLAVLVVALLTASVNLISMFATLFSLGLEDAVLGNAGWKVIPLVVVMMVVFAAFFSAVLLSLTSVARSFKEAQAYLIPLMLVSLTPGIFSLMPNLKMNILLAVTPLANTVLLGRDLLQGYFNPLMFAVVLISTAVYGLLALSIAARIFGSDAVLYGSGGSWSELLRRPRQPRAVAPLAVTWTTLAIVFPLFLVANSLPGRLQASMTIRLAAAAGVSIAIFVLVPLGLARLARITAKTGFALRSAPPLLFAAAALLGSALWAFVYEINLQLLSEERVAFLKDLYARMELDLDAVPLAVKIICLAVVPAAGEEFFFRGWLQNSLRTRFSAIVAVSGSAFLFGLFHVIVRDALFIERFVPSMLMGLVLGFLFERSGSVLPGMLLHVTHNGLLMTVSHYQQQLQAAGIGTAEREHLPASWLVAAAVPVALAIVILARQRSRFPNASASSL